MFKGSNCIRVDDADYDVGEAAKETEVSPREAKRAWRRAALDAQKKEVAIKIFRGSGRVVWAKSSRREDVGNPIKRR